jgi:DNA-binding NarL/FixJ family response regulator
MCKRVMLADDDPRVLYAVRRALEGTEFTIVATTQTDSQMLPQIDRTQPDILLLDVPEAAGSGLRLVDQLRQRHPELTVVVITNVCDPELIEGALRLGARAFLLKSLALSELPAVLRTLSAPSSAAS